MELAILFDDMVYISSYIAKAQLNGNCLQPVIATNYCNSFSLIWLFRSTTTSTDALGILMSRNNCSSLACSQYSKTLNDYPMKINLKGNSLDHDYIPMTRGNL